MNSLGELDGLAREHRSVLKDEPSTTVELLGRGPASVVKKTYRSSGLRLLQTFGRRSRAEREHENLVAVARTGVRCTEALLWAARRRFGFVLESTLVTRYLPDSQTLKHVLAHLPRDSHHRTRRNLAAAMGRLVAQLHAGGFLWCTPMPRNVLVLGDPANAQLAVCDTPAGITLDRPLAGTRLASIDVFAAALSPSRRAEFSATERWRWLLGYCDQDRTAARTLWRVLAHRSVLRHDAGRALAMTWYTYILSPLRPRRTPTRQRAS